MSHEHATDAEEEYLQIMFWLEEAGLPITGANIARAMQLSPPTVHEMIGRLERDGYVSRAADKSLDFTADGREHATAIVRRHRLIERFLTDVLGIPWDEVHEEAERMEHAMSPVLEERMIAAIGDAKTCPHGHPIVEGIREEGALLADVEPGASIVVLRFENEAEELLHYLKSTGIRPGLEGEIVSSDGGEIVVRSADGEHAISRSVAETVSVRADPAPAPRPRCRSLASRRTATGAEQANAGQATPGVPLARFLDKPATTPGSAGFSASRIPADLPQPPVEVLILGAHRELAPAHVRLVLAHRGRKRREAALAHPALAHRVELLWASLDHPYRAHPPPHLFPEIRPPQQRRCSASSFGLSRRSHPYPRRGYGPKLQRL